MGSLIRTSRATPRQARGYTLVELLVVLVVLGILASIVALKMRAPDDAAIRTDVERLADLFSLAADEAQVRARAITWQADAAGYRFVVQGEHGPVALDDEHFRARAWSVNPVTLRLLAGRITPNGDDGIEIVFPTDGVQPPFTLALSAGHTEVALAADGLGHYRLNPADAQP